MVATMYLRPKTKKRASTRPRDGQRALVYKSEKVAFNCPHFHNPEFTTMDECEAFAQLIKASTYYKAHGGWQRVKLSDGRARRGACYQPTRKPSGLRPGEIKLPKIMRHKWVIIHEFAHALVQVINRHAPAHGSTFCRVYIELVREVLGADKGAELETAFVNAGLKICPRESVKVAA